MQTNTLRGIHEGMKVFDATNHEIGKVEWVQFGADDPYTEEIETGAEENLDRGERTVADIIADAFRADELPDAVRARLLQEGFLRLDADGIFSADRYILPDQISSVSSDAVVLTVEKSDLVKTH